MFAVKASPAIARGRARCVRGFSETRVAPDALFPGYHRRRHAENRERGSPRVPPRL